MTLNRRSELIALRAAGISAWRFVMPAALAAAVIGILTVVAVNPIASQMNGQFERLKTQLLEGPSASTDKLIWLRQGDKHRQIIFVPRQRGAGGASEGRHHLHHSVQSDGSLQFQQRFEAADAVLKSNTWMLSGVKSYEPGALGSGATKMELPRTSTSRTRCSAFPPPTRCRLVAARHDHPHRGCRHLRHRLPAAISAASWPRR